MLVEWQNSGTLLASFVLLFFMEMLFVCVWFLIIVISDYWPDCCNGHFPAVTLCQGAERHLWVVWIRKLERSTNDELVKNQQHIHPDFALCTHIYFKFVGCFVLFLFSLIFFPLHLRNSVCTYLFVCCFVLFVSCFLCRLCVCVRINKCSFEPSNQIWIAEYLY